MPSGNWGIAPPAHSREAVPRTADKLAMIRCSCLLLTGPPEIVTRRAHLYSRARAAARWRTSASRSASSFRSGQTGNDSLLMPVTYRPTGDCYTAGSSLFPGQSGGQMAHLCFQVRLVSQRLRNLLPVNCAKSLPQTMYCHASGCLIDLQPPGYRAIINGSPFSRKAVFENFKVSWFACRLEFRTQAVDGQIQQRQRPLLIEGFIGGDGGRVRRQTAFCKGGIKRNRGLPPAAPLGGFTPPFLGQEPFQSDDEECPQLAFIGVGRFQPALLQKAPEELLGEVLRIMGRVTRASHVGIERIPVSPANGLQGHGRLGRGLLPCRQYHRPPRTGKDARRPTGWHLACHAATVYTSVTVNEADVTGSYCGWRQFRTKTLSDAPPRVPDWNRDATGAFAAAKVRHMATEDMQSLSQ